LPRASKPKARVHADLSVVAEVGHSVGPTLEQRKKQAEEPIYLNRM